MFETARGKIGFLGGRKELRGVGRETILKIISNYLSFFFLKKR